MNSDYKDTHRLSQFLAYSLYAQLAVLALMLFSHYLQLQLFYDFKSGIYVTDYQATIDAEASDRRQMIIGGVYMLSFLVSGILILRWIYSANHNSRQLGAEKMDFSPGWAVGWYFVPIANLWKPYQAMKEIWQTSHHLQNWSTSRVPPLLFVWWLLWLFSGLFSNIALRKLNESSAIDEFITMSYFQMADAVVNGILILVFLKVVSAIQTAQETRYAEQKGLEQEQLAVEYRSSETE